MYRREMDYGPLAGHRALAVPLSEQLIRQALVTEDGLFQLMASLCDVAILDPEELFERARWDADVELMRRLPRIVAQTVVMYPIHTSDGVLHVAAMDPTDWRGLAYVQLRCEAVDVRVSLARRSAVLDAIDTAYTAAELAGELCDDDSVTQVRKLPFIDPGDPRGKTMVTSAFPAVRAMDVMRSLTRPRVSPAGLRSGQLCVLRTDPAAEVLVRLKARDEVEALVVDEYDRPIGEIDVDSLVEALAIWNPPILDA